MAYSEINNQQATTYRYISGRLSLSIDTWEYSQAAVAGKGTREAKVGIAAAIFNNYIRRL